MRSRLSLDGVWQFEPTPGAAYNDAANPPGPLTAPRQIQVPGCLQAQFDDLRDYADVSVYERSFTVPTGWAGKAVRLNFGAVDYLAEVWIDGRYVGKHEGMFLPFTFDITEFVQPGRAQRLTVRVTDPGGAAWPEREYRAFPDIPFQEAPHGKQSWYGSIGGIWQEVWLEAGSAVYLRRVLATPDVAGSEARFRALLDGGAADGYAVMIRVTAPDGTTYESAVVPVVETVAVNLGTPLLWSPDTPQMYEFSAILLLNGRPVDIYQDAFGMRTVEARDNRIYLNGQPLFIRGALDQDYYPTTLWTVPSDAFLKEQMIRAKELGLNLLRCHIKAPHPRYLYWADRLGLLVWEEYGNFSHLEGRAGDLGRATLEGLIERDFNHPATIAWSIINESWGLDLSREKDRQWLLAQYAHFKQVDPTRLVVDNSACMGNYHLASDLADFHNYFAYPEHMGKWEAHMADLAGRPAWLWSPHGDARPTGTEPLLNSEFGNWGLPDPDDLIDEAGRDPWWFATGRTWNWGIVHPQGVRERFAASALPAVFGGYKEFAVASQVNQFRALKYEIEALRQHGALNGYVITELTDIHWEANGLLNQMRGRKAGHPLYRHVIAATQLIARPEAGRWALRPGESMQVEVMVAADGAEPVPGCRLDWWLETGVTSPLPAPGQTAAPQGSLMGITLPAFGTTVAGAVSFVAPTTEQRVRLHLILRDRRGQEVARSFADFAVFASPATGGFWLADDERLAGLRAAAATVGGAPAPGQVAVVSRLDPDAEAFARQGGRVLLLADAPDALPAPFRVAERYGERWQGDWATGWHWLHPDLLPTPALENPLDLPWAPVMPEHVLLGFDDQADWLGGITVGWLHGQAATVAGYRLGAGVVLATTFRLAEQAGRHPAADRLLGALLSRIADAAFQPRTNATEEA